VEKTDLPKDSSKSPITRERCTYDLLPAAAAYTFCNPSGSLPPRTHEAALSLSGKPLSRSSTRSLPFFLRKRFLVLHSCSWLFGGAGGASSWVSSLSPVINYAARSAVIRKILAHLGHSQSGPTSGPAPPAPGAAASGDWVRLATDRISPVYGRAGPRRS